MTITKKVLSLVLVLTMLLTMASFPAFADDPAYTPKTIELTASIRTLQGAYAGTKFLARPADNIYVGDILTIADNQTIVIPQNASNADILFLTSNTTADATKQITGLQIVYGTSTNDMWHNAYVKVDANGAMSGFYSSETFETSKDIKFDTAGIYLFAIQKYVDGTGTLQNYTVAHSSTGAETYLTQLNKSTTPYLWGIEVKDPANQLVTAPNKADYDLTTGTAAVTDIITQGNPALTATEGNIAYTEDYAPTGFASDASVSNGNALFTTVRADNTKDVYEPHSGLRIDFESVTYLEKFTAAYKWGPDTIVYDIYGSLNGTDWYMLKENQTSTSADSTNHTFNVDGVAKYFRLYIRDTNRMYGLSKQNITAITGQIGVLRVGEQPPTTCDVTFVDKSVLRPYDNITLTIDIGSKVTVPEEYATGKYNFYSDSACTKEIDITTLTFSKNTTVFVKTKTFDFPTDDSNEVPKIVMLVKGPGNVAVLPDGVKVNVGDTLLVPIGKPMNSANLRISPWNNYHVSRLSSEDGSVDKNYYSTEASKATNLIPRKPDGRISGVISITEPGVYTVMQNNSPISEEIWVDTYAKGTYVTQAPDPDKAYAAQTHELYYDETTTMFTLPAGAVVRVGDTLKFSTTLPIVDYPTPYPLVSTRQTIVSFDVNGNGYIDADEMAAIDSKGSRELDMLLKKGEVLITTTGVYAFATIDGDISSTWLAPITVNEYSLDPALIEGSNEIIYEESSALSSAVGMDTTEIVLNLKAKMAKGTVPAFTYSVPTTKKTVTLLAEESTADYDMYLVSSVFAFNADTMDITVEYGDNFRITAADTFSRKKSDDVFSTSLLEGDNVFYVSNLKPKFNATASTLRYIYFEISTQKFVGGVTEGVINGVEYKDLKIELVDVISKSSKFEPFTLETFCYDPAKEVYNASLALKGAGLDQFFATVQLTGINQNTKQYEVIEEKVFSTEMIEIAVEISKDDNHRIGGEPKNVPLLLDQLRKVYADKNYVIIDCINEYLVDENGDFILDEAGNKIKNLAQKNPVDAIYWQVDDVLWNGLINMNKAYFEFRFAAPTNDPLYGRNHIIRDQQCIEYSIRIDKTSHNMIRLNENAFFRLGMRFNSPAVKKALKNSVREQLGNAYDPLFFNISWWMASVPFTQATYSMTLPEEWTVINGTEDLKLYRYTGSGETATLALDREGLKVNDRFDNVLTFDISGQYFYAQYALVGTNNTVERPGDETAKHNVATGGADLVATFATFAGIALAAYALKKRED